MNYSNQYYPPKINQQQHQGHMVSGIPVQVNHIQGHVGPAGAVGQHGPGPLAQSSITVHNTTPGQNRRGPWSPEEDRKLMELISIFGPSNWVRISNTLNTRTPKQCRERYHQNLKPSLNRTPITNEEGELIEKLVAKYGKKWAEIARHLNGRSDNAIKNWWNGGANRRRRASTQVGIKDDEDSIAAASALANQRAKSIDKPLPNVPQQSSQSHSQSHSQSQPQSQSQSQSSINSNPLPQPQSQPQSQPQPQSQGQAPLSSTPMSASGPPVPQKLPSAYPQVPHLPQISFNTSMFGSQPPPPPPQNSKDGSNTPPQFPLHFRSNNLRLASFDIHAGGGNFVLPSISGQSQSQSHPLTSTNSNGSTNPASTPVPASAPHHPITTMLPLKRRLIDESNHINVGRRHSTANTIYSNSSNGSGNYYTNSNPNLSQAIPPQIPNSSSTGNVSPYYGSPLLLGGHPASRHNSISHFEFSTLNASSNNSSSTSRRSSIAPDFFPNPLGGNNNNTNNNNHNNHNSNSHSNGSTANNSILNMSALGSNGSTTTNSINSPHLHKRTISQNSFNSPSISTGSRFSISGPSGVTKLTQISSNTCSNNHPLPPINLDQKNSPTKAGTFEEKEKVITTKSKIAVSNLID